MNIRVKQLILSLLNCLWVVMRIILTSADCLLSRGVSPTDHHSAFGLEIPWTKTTFRSVENLQDCCTRDFSDPLCKDDNYNNSKMISFSKNAQVTLVERPQLKRIRFQIYKHWYQLFKDVIVNRALPSVDEGSLENYIILTVSLIELFSAGKAMLSWQLDFSFFLFFLLGHWSSRLYRGTHAHK